MKAAMLTAGGGWCHRVELSRLERCQRLRDCCVLSAEHLNTRELQFPQRPHADSGHNNPVQRFTPERGKGSTHAVVMMLIAVRDGTAELAFSVHNQETWRRTEVIAYSALHTLVFNYWNTKIHDNSFLVAGRNTEARPTGILIWTVFIHACFLTAAAWAGFKTTV